MKPMVFEPKLFGNENRYKKRDSEDNLHLTIDVPDSLDRSVIQSHLLHWCAREYPFTRQQLESLIKLLTMAESFGHDINLMLTRATASNWKQVVYDNHLKPKENPSA